MTLECNHYTICVLIICPSRFVQYWLICSCVSSTLLSYSHKPTNVFHLCFSDRCGYIHGYRCLANVGWPLSLDQPCNNSLHICVLIVSLISCLVKVPIITVEGIIGIDKVRLRVVHAVHWMSQISLYDSD